MRVFAISDIHVDYSANAHWVQGLSLADHQDDALILAGDVSDTLSMLGHTLETLAKRFRYVLFVPGNHDLWVIRDHKDMNSLDKFEQIKALVRDSGCSMQALCLDSVAIVPLLSWYDFSFGEPGDKLRDSWMDFRACRWPAHFDAKDITRHFLQLNSEALETRHHHIISFSHFLPRIDMMPSSIPPVHRALYPVLGTSQLDLQIRALNARMHVCGHSHVNRRVTIGGIQYINNAFGYPTETHIASKRLLCIHEG